MQQPRRIAPVSVAPMMDRTDRHFRFLIRQISRRALLYTEMVTAIALCRGDRRKLLDFDASEHPLALQLGGDDPTLLAEATRIGVDWGYDEINLNVGCPSDRVQSGNFGACLMLRPAHVARCVEAMREAIVRSARRDVEVTVKHRIGVDEVDRYEDMLDFVDAVARTGTRRFSVHARKAWLRGLSPKQNRNVPPLRHAEVHRLKRERPQLDIEINGGITSVESIHQHLAEVDAVMIGRAAYDRPYSLFSRVDAEFFADDQPPKTRRQVVAAFGPYAAERLVEGRRPVAVLRHALNIYAGEPGNKAWKRALDGLCRELVGGLDGPGRTAAIEALPTRLLDALDDVERQRTEFFARRSA